MVKRSDDHQIPGKTRGSRDSTPNELAPDGQLDRAPDPNMPLPEKGDETEIKEIIRQIQDGNGQLFQELVDRYRSQVAGIAYKLVRDSDDVKDITQIVFVKMFYNIKRFDLSKRFSTWLYRIAVNAAIDHIRKFKKHRFEDIDETTETPASGTATPERIYQLKEVREYVLEAMEKLNEKQRAAFVLKDLEGLDIEETAQIMGMPQATVRWYLHRARKRLRQDLRRRFGPFLGRLGIGRDK